MTFILISDGGVCRTARLHHVENALFFATFSSHSQVFIELLGFSAADGDVQVYYHVNLKIHHNTDILWHQKVSI